MNVPRNISKDSSRMPEQAHLKPVRLVGPTRRESLLLWDVPVWGKTQRSYPNNEARYRLAGTRECPLSS